MASIRRLCCVILLLLSLFASGCGVLYTVVKSEAKLDRLAIPMKKAQVVERIGMPDRILRDDGRVLVWEYSLTARKQWLYELGLCPLSVWVGGCIIYPFTNIAAEHNREYPYHVVLVDEELCAWGPPAAILQRRRTCAASGTPGLRTAGAAGRPEPVVTGIGPVDRDTIDRYRTMAVMPLEDAPGAQGSGSRVAGMTTTLLLDLDLHIVERARLQEVLNEQLIQLTHTDDARVLKIGELVGAQAMVAGEVQQWEQGREGQPSHVSLSVRFIDVETGLLLFNGEGHLTDPGGEEPEHLARAIVHRILVRLGSQTGLLGSGQIGVNWDLHEATDGRFYVVREVRSRSPAEQAGVQTGDQVIACNGMPLATVKSDHEAKRLCQVEAGRMLVLGVRRDGHPLEITVTAEKRPGL